VQVVEACFVFTHLRDEVVGSPDFFHKQIHHDRVSFSSVEFIHFGKDHVFFIVSEGEGAAIYIAGYVLGNEQLAVVMEMVFCRGDLREVDWRHGLLHFFLFPLFLAGCPGVVVLVHVEDGLGDF
jgi:hypothetical protein